MSTASWRNDNPTLDNWFLDGNLIGSPVGKAHFALPVGVVRVHAAILVIVRKRDNFGLSRDMCSSTSDTDI